MINLKFLSIIFFTTIIIYNNIIYLFAFIDSINAGGYRFRFSRAHQLGYILPEWVDERTLASLPEPLSADVTNFYLPLRESHELEVNRRDYAHHIQAQNTPNK